MEPRPWPEDGATEIEKALLRAGRAEVPRKGADLRILAMLQGSSPGSSQGSVGPNRPAVALARWVKVGLIAVVAGGAALVAYQLSRTARSPAFGHRGELGGPKDRAPGGRGLRRSCTRQGRGSSRGQRESPKLPGKRRHPRIRVRETRGPNPPARLRCRPSRQAPHATIPWERKPGHSTVPGKRWTRTGLPKDCGYSTSTAAGSRRGD